MALSQDTGASATVVWDDSQRAVIEAPAGGRLIVDAGPGTGKTAVACARVAHLINSGAVSARGVWLISFTRTAVKEIRARIAACLDDPDALWSVRIATVDSHAWSLHQGFSEGASLSGFDDNITRVIALLERNEGLQDYISETDHLIVDEAQDLVGIRADLIAALVARMRKGAGVTVFADEAQAIYGFASDAEEDTGAEKGESLTTRLMARGDFSRTVLDTVHRTKAAGLLQIFTKVRALVIAPGHEPQDRLEAVRAAISGHADADTDAVFKPDAEMGSDVFMLFRRRSEVLQASSFLCQRGRQHRLRMSGFPAIIPAWIGAVFGGLTIPLFGRDEFVAKAQALGAHGPADAEAAFAALERLARGPRGSIDLKMLRAHLARPQPPLEIALPDYGAAGPVLGTIHAAKGRETDAVWLMLPPEQESDAAAAVRTDWDEEARIVFVGATRARSSLTIGRGYRLYAKNLATSGRVFALKQRNMVQVEIGRAGDVSASSMVGRTLYRTADEAATIQKNLAQFDGVIVEARADCDRSAGFTYRLSAGAMKFGAFAQTLNRDLFDVGKAQRERRGGGRRRPPDYLQHFHLTGVRTIVLKPDDPELGLLHEPWASSGFLLAPMAHGYVTTPLMFG